MLLDVRVDHLKIVQDILKKHVPEREVWAFGSRAKWLAKEYSDLDLCILGETPLSFRTLGLLEEAFEDSDLPYTVDVVDWATTSESFRKIIKRDRVLVQKVGRGLGAEWVDIRLGDACTKIGSGATPKGGGSVYLNEGPIAFVRSQNIHNEGLSKEGMVYLDEKLAQGLANVQVEELDVLLNITGDSVARACQVIKEVLPARVNQHVVIIRANQKILWPTYLRYFLVSSAMQAHMLGLAAVGATRNALTKGMIESFTIRCPKEVDYQKAIADVLGSFDDKIAVNRRINQTLETIAQAIFKSWFVDFDPVKAKIASKQEGFDPLRAAMCAISGKTDAELDTLSPEQYDSLAATAALFPDEMEESELGAIPRGWIPDFLSAICDLNSSNWSAITLPDSVQYVDSANTKNGEVCAIQPLEGTNIPSRARRILEPGDTIVGTVRPGNRSFAFVGEPGFTGSTGFAVLRPKQDFLREYVYLVATSDENIARLAHLADGGAYPAVRPELVASVVMPIPNDDLLLVFHLLSSNMFNHILANRRANRALAGLRDTLLPKLLSGELSVENISLKSEATA